MLPPSRSNRRRPLYLLAVVGVIFLVGFNAGQVFQVYLGTKPGSGQDRFQVLSVANALTSPENYLSFQGQLTTNTGAPVTTATTMDFSLYDQATGGNLIYNESQSVTPDSRGLFYVSIGCGYSPCSGVTAALGSPAGSQTWPPSFDVPYWLAVRIYIPNMAGQTYLSPRISLTNAPYSLNRSSAPIETLALGGGSCSISSATTSAAFTTPATYTTGASSSGSLYVGMSFNVASPATSALTSKWQLVYGSGSAPACAATAGLGTTVGEQYTVLTQVASVGSWGQSVGVVITGLVPNTAYWFDAQVTDSSAGTWVYSSEAVSVSDVLASTNAYENVVQSANTNTCTHTASATTLMAGFGLTYTTMAGGSSGAGSGSGNIRATLSFNLQSPATLADTNKFIFAYGTGASPSCNAASTGTAVGKQYTVESAAASAISLEQSISVAINGLLPSTTYWFDLQSTDLSTNQWITSLPTLAVSEEPSLNGANVPANVVHVPSEQAASCTTSAATTTMTGIKELYTLTSGSPGTIYGSITVNVLASGTIAAGDTSAWKLVYSDVTSNAVPACAAAAVGTAVTVGQTYTTETVSTTAFSEAQTEHFVISGLVGGHTYWFDFEATNAGASFTAAYSLPNLVITEPQSPDIPDTNVIFLKGSAVTCTVATSGAAQMAGSAVIPATAFPPMQYQTTSYGSGNLVVTISLESTTINTVSSTYAWALAYGPVTDPASGVSASANPACNAAASGVTGLVVVGNTYTFTNVVATAGKIQETVSVGIDGLSHGTTYWFDLECTNSVANAVTSLPQISITEPAS